MHAPDGRPIKLVAPLPSELATWMHAQLNQHGIPIKRIPTESDLRQNIRERFDTLMEGHLWEGVKQRLAVAGLMEILDGQLGLTQALQTKALDRAILLQLSQPRNPKSYRLTLDEAVGGFFDEFMYVHAPTISQLARQHIQTQAQKHS